MQKRLSMRRKRQNGATPVSCDAPAYVFLEEHFRREMKPLSQTLEMLPVQFALAASKFPDTILRPPNTRPSAFAHAAPIKNHRTSTVCIPGSSFPQNGTRVHPGTRPTS